MIYVQETLISSNDQQTVAELQTVQIFLGEHGSALANAAFHLGGGSSSGAVFQLIEAVRDARKLTKSHFRQLEKLNVLLQPEQVGDFKRSDAALFAEGVPISRLVNEICLLADALNSLLAQLRHDDHLDTVDRGLDLSEAA